MSKTRYTYNQNEIVTTKIDGYNLWIAFKGSGTEAKLLKVNAINPSEIYYEITVDAREINSLALQSTNFIVLALDSDDYIGEIISRTNPLVSYSYIDKPSGIVEEAIDCAYDSNFYYFLTPGVASGEIPKILQFNTSLVLTDTIDLELSGEIITNARSLTIDASGNLWIVTYTDPVKLIKVSKPVATWIIETWELT